MTEPAPTRDERCIAVVVYVEVDGQWIDPDNVAEAIVSRLISGDPRGMNEPHEVKVQNGKDSDVYLTGRVWGVEDLGGAAASGNLRVTAASRKFR